MPRLIVRLPDDRSFAGLLRLESDEGTLLAGAFEVCGRADDRMAALHGNVRRDPRLPYGDTPLGAYRVARVLESGEGTGFLADQFGPNGVVVLEPVAGEAALADANGRFQVLIQGGSRGPGDCLRTTNGSLRLSDRDQRELVRILRLLGDVECTCVAGAPAGPSRKVATQICCADGDPVRALSRGLTPDEPVLSAAWPGGSAFGSSLGPSPTRRRFSPPAFRAFASFSGGGGGSGDSSSYGPGDTGQGGDTSSSSGTQGTGSPFLSDSYTGGMSTGPFSPNPDITPPGSYSSLQSQGLLNASFQTDASSLSANQSVSLDPNLSSANQCRMPDGSPLLANQIGLPESAQLTSYQGDAGSPRAYDVTSTPETAVDSVPEKALDPSPEKDANFVALQGGTSESDQAPTEGVARLEMTLTATPEKSPDSGEVDYGEVALKLGEGVVEGAVGAVAIAGLAAASPALGAAAIIAGGGLALYSGFEAITGMNPLTGSELSSQQRWDIGAQLAGGFVGGIATGGVLTADMFGGTDVVGTPSDVTTLDVTTPGDTLRVSRWGGQGLQPENWVMTGDPTLNNYIISGKWQPWLPGVPEQWNNVPAPFNAGQAFDVPSNSVQTPSGWGFDGWIKSLFGQKIYSPPGPDGP